jgi:hypothetical protein
MQGLPENIGPGNVFGLAAIPFQYRTTLDHLNSKGPES